MSDDSVLTPGFSVSALLLELMAAVTMVLLGVTIFSVNFVSSFFVDTTDFVSKLNFSLGVKLANE